MNSLSGAAARTGSLKEKRKNKIMYNKTTRMVGKPDKPIPRTDYNEIIEE